MKNVTKKMVINGINGIINSIANMSIPEIMMLDSMVDAMVIKAIMPKKPINSINDIPNIDGYIKLAKEIVGDCDACTDSNDYDEREAELDNREENLDEREGDLNDLEEELNEREEELNAREAELNKRECDLDDREAALIIREANLNDDEDMLVEYDDEDVDVDVDEDDWDEPHCADNTTINYSDARKAVVDFIGQIANLLK
jgi:hypothetical protein